MNDIVTSILDAVGSRLGEAVGDATVGAGQAVVRAVRRRLGREPGGPPALAAAETDPAALDGLRVLLDRILDHDERFVAELRLLCDATGDPASGRHDTENVVRDVQVTGALGVGEQVTIRVDGGVGPPPGGPDPHAGRSGHARPVGDPPARPEADTNAIRGSTVHGIAAVGTTVNVTNLGERPWPDWPPPQQLPPRLGNFTGRADLVGQVTALAGAGLAGDLPGPAVAAIVGTAGVGKTSLALHCAHLLKHRYPGGTLFVDLHGRTPGVPPVRPAQALSRFLRALGVAPERIPVDQDEQEAMYRERVAARPTVVVLDDAGDAAQVRPLLPGSERCLVLLTSRTRLDGLAGYVDTSRIEVGVLDQADAVGLVTSMVGTARVSVDRAAADDLAAQCAYLPLALRIAAGHLACHPTLALSTMAAGLRVADRLGAFEPSGAPEGVRRVFATSYAALPADARRLFRRLGLVPVTDLDSDAVAHLSGLPHARTAGLLDLLEREHLVEQQPAGRFRFHALLRDYARERASAEDREGARRQAENRLLSYYLATADAAATLLAPQLIRLPMPFVPEDIVPRVFADAGEALGWLDRERANLVAAVGHAAQRGHESAWWLADALRGYFLLHPFGVEWLAVAEAGLRAARDRGWRGAEAAMHNNLGTARWMFGDLAGAGSEFEEYVRISRAAHDLPAVAAGLSNLVAVCRDAGRLDDASHYGEQALRLARASDDVPSQASVLNNLATVTLLRGDLDGALVQAEQGEALNRTVGDRGGEAIALDNAGVALLWLGRLAEAEERVVRGGELNRDTGDLTGAAASQDSLARLRRAAGRLAEATALAEGVLARTGTLDGSEEIRASARVTLGTVADLAGDHAAALAHFGAAREAARPDGIAWIEAMVGTSLASSHLGHLDAALDAAHRAVTGVLAGGYRVYEGSARTALAVAEIARGGYPAGCEAAVAAVGAHRASGHRIGLAEALVVLGHAAAPCYGGFAAGVCREQARALFEAIGIPPVDLVRPASPGPGPAGAVDGGGR